MILRLSTFVGAVIGAALLVSACTSSPASTSAHASRTPSSSATRPDYAAGPDPCLLVTSQAIFTTLSERMVKASSTRSSCSYMNAHRTSNVSISTAQTTRTKAEQAVAGTAHTVKVKVHHPRGIGDTAIAYLTTSRTRSIATCLFAKNGTIVFLYAGGPRANHLLPEIIALARTVASHA